MNLLGTCVNKACTAFGETICIKKGIGTFEMDKEINMSKCPSCSSFAKDVTIPIFCRCLFSIEGEMEDGKKIERLNVPAPRDKFLIFEDEGEDLGKWESLVITTTSVLTCILF